MVEEEPLVQDICNHLQREGFRAVGAVDGLGGLGLFRQHPPVLVVLGLMLPGINGLVLCRLIRAESRIPIIMLSPKNDADDKVAGFEVGFSILELIDFVLGFLRFNESWTTFDPADDDPPPLREGKRLWTPKRKTDGVIPIRPN